MKRFFQGKLSRTIFVSLVIASFSLLVVFGLVFYSLLKHTLSQHLEEDLTRQIDNTSKLVETSAHFSIKSYLRAIAELNSFNCGRLQRDVLAGSLNLEQAKERARSMLLAQHIGSSGYLFAIDSTGSLVVHPHAELAGTDISEFAFIKEMITTKRGLISYRWKNPGDPDERDKIIYISYFAPWDWIIAVSAYRDELWQLLALDDQGLSALSTPESEHELVFVVAQSGAVLVHPHLTSHGATLPPEQTALIDTMLKRHDGTITYPLSLTPGTPKTDYLVLFTTIDDFGLTVAAATDIAYHYAPLASVKRLLILLFLISLVGIMIVSLVLSRVITAPLKTLLDRISRNSSTPLPKSPTDVNELTALSEFFFATISELQQANARHEKLLEQQRQLSMSLAIYQKIFETSPDGMVITDADGIIERVNPAFEQITGFQADDAIGKTPRILKSGEHGSDFYQQMWQSITERGYWSGKILNRNRDKEIFPELLTIYAIGDMNRPPTHYAAIFSDLRQIIEQEEQIRFLAFHDQLTSLPNRLLVIDRLQQTIAACKRHGHEAACMIIDLDNFKTINDSLGHASGDEVLKLFAKRLLALIREEDTLGRAGGDEFIYVHRNKAAGTDATVSLIKRIFQTLETPFHVGEQHIHLSISVGIAVFPGDGTTTEDLMKRSDMALLRARSQAGNCYQFFDMAMEVEVKKKLHFHAMIRDALQNREFVPFYQPKIDLHNGRPVGLEALARWISGTTIISPGEFIGVAEQSGTIFRLTEQIYEQAFADLRVLLDRGYDLSLSVNISPPQLKIDNFPDTLHNLLSSAGLNPSSIELEITESLLMEHVSVIKETLNRFVRDGYSLAVDDFGTGYSSLSYLKQIPLTTLKIDRSFVFGIGKSSSDEQLVTTIVMLAKQFGLDVVAEGIETREQAVFLRRLDCTSAQGFLFARPMPFSDLLIWLEKHPFLDIAGHTV